MHFAATTFIAIALASALLLAPARAAAQDIQVKVGNCKSGVQLVARDAPLSAVLERLAQSLKFQLHVEAPADTLVNVNTSAPAPELITMLAAQERVMVSQAADPRCPGKFKVVRVWVLPKGQPVPVAAPKEVKKPVPVTHTATREQLRAQEETSRKLKEQYDAYVKTHGKPPPGEEEEAARP